MFNQFGDLYRRDRGISLGYWQSAFVHSNLPIIGYYAWSGFESFGRGLVICRVQPPSVPITCLTLWQFTTQFIPLDAVDAGLQEMGVEAIAIPSLIQAIDLYNPLQDMMLLIQSGKQLEVNWIRNADQPPAECYRQVCDRWEEFFPCSLFSEASDSLNDS
jgi:hypothetical protein